MATLEASWLPGLLLLLERAGYREETYFTVSHAPAFGDDGRVAGMHAVCTEMTGQILGERRQRLLHDLSTVGGRLGRRAGDRRARCAARWRATRSTCRSPPSTSPSPASPASGGSPRWAATRTCCPAAAGRERRPGRGRRTGSASPAARSATAVTEAVVLPLTASGTASRSGLLLAGKSPNRASDAEYRSFYELVAGQFAGAVVNIRAFEAERLRAESLAELDRAKTTFFSDVSHELRTPLTLLLGPIGDVLEDTADPLPAGVQEQLHPGPAQRPAAAAAGQRPARLRQHRGRPGAARCAWRPTSPRSPPSSPASSAPPTERAGLRLTVDCPPLDRRPTSTRGCGRRSSSTCWPTRSSTRSSAASTSPCGRTATRFELTVSDTGVGIVAEELPQLFQRFHRVAGATARTREGTGIGLALVHELAALHGGDVSVESEPGTGSTFTRRPALRRPRTSSRTPPRPAVSPSEAARGEAASWERGHLPAGRAAATARAAGSVLVVDDNADMRAYLTRLLGPHWAVRTTANGEEALAAVAEQRAGHRADRRDDAAGRRLRAAPARCAPDPATRDIPVIMLTARAGQEASVEGLEAGADDYLAKPFRADELIARVRVVAGAGRPAGARPPTAAAAGRAAAPVADRRSPVAGGRTRRSGPARRPLAGRAAPAARRPAGRWRLPSERVVHPGAAPRPAGLAGDRRRRRRTRPTTCSWPPARRRRTPSSTPRTPPSRSSTSPRRSATATCGSPCATTASGGSGCPSMDRGRGSTLMSAVGEITATPSPEGTTVVITSPLGRRTVHRHRLTAGSAEQPGVLAAAAAAASPTGPAPSATRVSGAGSAAPCRRPGSPRTPAGPRAGAAGRRRPGSAPCEASTGSCATKR